MIGKPQELPDTVHGRLLEAVHISGYSFERACSELEWLLEEERWKRVGNGYDNVNTFIETLRFSGFKDADAIERRVRIAEKLKELEASQRATARLLGVDESTVREDLGTRSPRAGNPANNTPEPAQTNGSEPSNAGNPAWFQGDGAAAAGAAEKAATPDEPKPNHRAQGTGENEWFTPLEYIAAAKLVMGAIDLDPATHPDAQAKIKARKYYTKREDGLRQQWAGRVWLNPPYSQPQIDDFVKKMVEQWAGGNISAAIMLTHNYTDTAWFHRAEAASNLVCFTRGRIKFVDIDGNDCAPTQGQTFFYFGDKPDKFSRVFRQFGFVR